MLMVKEKAAPSVGKSAQSARDETQREASPFNRDQVDMMGRCLDLS
jgi:hypothetical protein